MTLDGASKAIGEIARPATLVGGVGTVFYALHLHCDVGVVIALCSMVGGMYLGKAAETVGVAKVQSGGAP